MISSNSHPRPPLVILTGGLYWCLAAATAAYFIFAFTVRGRMLELLQEFGVVAGAPPVGDDALNDSLRKILSMSSIIIISATTAVVFGLMGAFGATLLLMRRKSGLSILRGITWLVAFPFFFLCMWNLAMNGTAGLGSLVQCIPFALLLCLLYCGPVQKYCATRVLS